MIICVWSSQLYNQIHLSVSTNYWKQPISFSTTPQKIGNRIYRKWSNYWVTRKHSEENNKDNQRMIAYSTKKDTPHTCVLVREASECWNPNSTTWITHIHFSFHFRSFVRSLTDLHHPDLKQVLKSKGQSILNHELFRLINQNLHIVDCFFCEKIIDQLYKIFVQWCPQSGSGRRSNRLQACMHACMHQSFWMNACMYVCAWVPQTRQWSCMMTLGKRASEYSECLWFFEFTNRDSTNAFYRLQLIASKM